MFGAGKGGSIEKKAGLRFWGWYCKCGRFGKNELIDRGAIGGFPFSCKFGIMIPIPGNNVGKCPFGIVGQAIIGKRLVLMAPFLLVEFLCIEFLWLTLLGWFLPFSLLFCFLRAFLKLLLDGNLC